MKEGKNYGFLSTKPDYCQIIDQCGALLNSCAETIYPLVNNHKKLGGSVYKLLLYNMLLAYIKYSDSIYALLKKGDSHSAFILLRTSYELHVQQLYVRIKPDLYSSQYLSFANIEFKRTFDKITQVSEEIRREEVDEWRERYGIRQKEFEQNFEVENSEKFRYWSDMTLWNMCQKVDEKWTNAYRLVDLYKTLFNRASSLSHAGPSTICSFIGTDGETIYPNIGEEAVYLELVINKVCSFVYEFLRIIDDEFKLNLDFQLDKFNNEVVKIGARK